MHDYLLLLLVPDYGQQDFLTGAVSVHCILHSGGVAYLLQVDLGDYVALVDPCPQCRSFVDAHV